VQGGFDLEFAIVANLQVRAACAQPSLPSAYWASSAVGQQAIVEIQSI
jgi:hypothetical protein